MKKLNIIRLVILLTLVVFIGSSSALAVDTSKDNTVVIQLDPCKLAYLISNQYYGPNRPLIIFIPGSNECTNIQKTLNWIRDYELYDNIDCDLIAFSMNSSSIWYKDWESACEDVISFILPYYSRLSDDEVFPIIVDAVSFGGYGGIYLVQCGKRNGIFMDELNMADACGYGVIPDMIEYIVNRGTFVNIWASSGSGGISISTRKVISELEGSPNFYGEDFPSPHGAVLHKAIYEKNLHSEFAVGE